MRERRAQLVHKRLKENNPSWVWMVMLGFTLVGNVILGVNANLYVSKLREYRPDYPFPTIYDLWPYFIMLGICIGFKITIESAVFYISDSIMDLKYLKPDQTEMKKLIRRKLASNIFKCIYYSSAAVFGYFTLVGYEYYPREIGGNNSISAILKKGYPNAFFYEKSDLFVMHYCYCLTYAFIDLIWLLFIYARQSDFHNMLVHHICSISLIIFSYVTNFSHLGTVVLFLHNATDVVVYINRAMLYSRLYQPIKNVLPITLLSSFFFRLYVLTKIIYSIYFDIPWDHGGITLLLWIFLVFLYIMHANWACILSKNYYDVIVYGRMSDTFKFKKQKKA